MGKKKREDEEDEDEEDEEEEELYIRKSTRYILHFNEAWIQFWNPSPVAIDVGKQDMDTLGDRCGRV